MSSAQQLISQFLEKVQRRLSDSSKSLHCNGREVVQWRQTAVLRLLSLIGLVRDSPVEVA